MIKLIRNLDGLKNKEQEASFENTLNINLFFDSNSIIYRADLWTMNNVKRLISSLNNLDKELDFEIEFSRWNKNIDLIFSNLNNVDYQNQELDENEKKIISSKDFKEVHKLLLSFDKNKKLSFLLFISDSIKDNSKYKINLLIDKIINGGLSNIDTAIDFVLPLFFKED